jgi:hypothetical protein
LYQIIITDANGCTAFENNILIATTKWFRYFNLLSWSILCWTRIGRTIGTSVTAPTGPGPYHFAVYSQGLTYTG